MSTVLLQYCHFTGVSQERVNVSGLNSSPSPPPPTPHPPSLSLSNNCTAGSAGNPVCNCRTGHEGGPCDSCSEGYFGQPPAFRCTLCDCNGNIDFSDPGSCDRVTGRCVKCINNTMGDECEECATGYYGNATQQNCQRESVAETYM